MARAAVFALSHRTNASFEAVNAALAEGATVQLAEEPVKTANGMERGAFLVSGIDRAKMEDLTKKYEVPAIAVSAPAHTLPIKKARVGLYRPWTPSIDEGWTRWILENYGFAPREHLQRRHPLRWPARSLRRDRASRHVAGGR